MYTFSPIVIISGLFVGFTLLGACSNDAPEPEKKAETPAPKLAEPEPIAPAINIPEDTKIEVTADMAGKKVYRRCKACHTLDKGAPHRVGPNLYGIFGRKAGTAEGFAYSKAMTASDIIWNAETMDAYITSPKTYIPKNTMAFIGLKKQTDRDSLIAYLKAKTSSE